MCYLAMACSLHFDEGTAKKTDMKTQAKKMTRILLVSGMILTIGFSQLLALDLVVTGVITKHGEKLEGANIELYEANELIKATVTGKNGKFRMRMWLDTSYTLKVTYPGYISKTISFSTNVDRNGWADHVFYIHIDLFKLNVKPKSYVEDDAVALIRYSSSIETFAIDWAFTSPKQRELFHLRKLQVLYEPTSYQETAKESDVHIL